MVFPDELIRRARTEAGLTQAALAARLGTTQSAIAKLERPGSNPTVETLDRVLRAAGARLRISSSPFPEGVDDTLIAAALRRTPAERVAQVRQLHEFARTVRPPRGRPA